MSDIKIVTVARLREWLNSLPPELDNAHIDGVVHGRPCTAKRVVAFTYKDGSGAGVVVNPMGTHLDDAFWLVAEVFSMLDVTGVHP